MSISGDKITLLRLCFYFVSFFHRWHYLFEKIAKFKKFLHFCWKVSISMFFFIYFRFCWLVTNYIWDFIIYIYDIYIYNFTFFRDTSDAEELVKLANTVNDTMTSKVSVIIDVSPYKYNKGGCMGMSCIKYVELIYSFWKFINWMWFINYEILFLHSLYKNISVLWGLKRRHPQQISIPTTSG